MEGEQYKHSSYYEEYKTAITQVVVNEENLYDLPIFYNVNFGHAKPIGIIPYGIKVELNCENKTIILLECPTTPSPQHTPPTNKKRSIHLWQKF